MCVCVALSFPSLVLNFNPSGSTTWVLRLENFLTFILLNMIIYKFSVEILLPPSFFLYFTHSSGCQAPVAWLLFVFSVFDAASWACFNVLTNHCIFLRADFPQHFLPGVRDISFLGEMVLGFSAHLTLMIVWMVSSLHRIFKLSRGRMFAQRSLQCIRSPNYSLYRHSSEVKMRLCDSLSKFSFYPA